MFKPTFLYIKQHCSTGLLYFGKTTRKNVLSYKGSGVFWKRHLKKHGTDVETLWYCLFTDENSCREFAESFSNINNIVEDSRWANLIIENGLDGAAVGHPSFISNPEDVAKKISEKSLENWKNVLFREKVIESQKKSWTAERRELQAEITRLMWTDEMRNAHSLKLKGKPGSKALKGIPKTKEHNRKNSEALLGKKKSEEHKKNMKEALQFRKICRIHDRKIMSVSHFSRWLKSLIKLEPSI